jgi:hypothetical protein
VYDAVLALEKAREEAIDSNDEPLLRAYDQVLMEVRQLFRH